MKTKAFFALTALTASLSAQAVDTVQMTGFTYNPFTGGNPTLPFDPANAITKNTVGVLPSAPPPPGVYIGGGQMTGLFNGMSFVAYCVEISTLVLFGPIYTNYVPVAGAAGFGATKATDLAKLMTWASTSGKPSNAFESAAIQSAVWEIVHEPGFSYSFSADLVTASSANTNTAAALAAIPWATIAATTPTYTVSRLDSPNTQDLLIFTPAVPEVGTSALFALGLVGVGLVARRRAV